MKAVFATLALLILPLYGDVVVTSTNDSELRAAVAQGGRITFSVDGKFLLTNQLEITKPTEIDGTSRQITISGQDQVRLFVISNTIATLRALTLSNGKVQSANADLEAMIPAEPALGAGIYSTMSTVLVENCSISNHLAAGGVGNTPAPPSGASLDAQAGYGGAIYFAGGELRVTNSSVQNGSSVGGRTSWGKLGPAYGGAMYATNANVVISNSRITHSVAAAAANFPFFPTVALPASGGGAFFTESTVTISHSMFASNSATGGGSGSPAPPCQGGAIYSDRSLIVNSCVFSNNVLRGSFGSRGADAEGGAIFSSGSLLIQDSFFAGNQAWGGGGTGRGNARDVVGNGHGGAAFATGSTEVENSTFWQNGAFSPLHIAATFPATPGYARGGALYIAGTNAVLQYLTIITNVVAAVGQLGFEDPAPNTAGGGIFVGQEGGATVLASILVGNYLTTSFGTIAESGAAATVSGPITDDGWNLVSDSPSGFSAGTTITNADPVLGPLGIHGGSTPVFPLFAGSPAINAAQTTPDTPVDQRGRVRPYGAAADIGAYESSAPFFVMGKIRGYDVANAQISAPGSTSVPSPAGEYYLFFAEPGTNTITVQVESAIVIPKSPSVNVTVDQLLDFNSYQFNSVNAGSPVPGGIELIFAGTPNTSYILEKSTDFAAWSEAGRFTTDADGIFRSNQLGREEEFFRVRRE